MDLELWCDLHLEHGQRKGDEYPAMCPWCGRTGKFSVNIDKEKFNCYRDSCEAPGGWVGQLLAHVEGITFAEARAKLGVQSYKPEAAHRKVRPATRGAVEIALPSDFIKCHVTGRKIKGEPRPWRVPKKLSERGVERRTMDHYGLGFCTNGTQYNRVIIPINCAGARAWTARDLTNEHETNERRPKYYNPPGSWASDVFFGWDEADTDGADLVIVEGPFDVLRLHAHGINAVSMLGKELGKGQLELLFSLPRRTTVTLMLDPEVSWSDLKKTVAQIPRRLRAYVAILPAGIDPGESTREQAIAAIDGARLGR